MVKAISGSTSRNALSEKLTVPPSSMVRSA
jgi:hypothetical protein